LAGSSFVRVKIDGFGNFLRKKSDVVNFDSLKGYLISHACTLREISETREGVHTGDDNETTLRKWETLFKILTFRTY